MKPNSVTQDRDKYIGGSDIPIIMGISPFKTRWQLLKEKAEPTGEGITNEYTNPQIEYGNEMEPKIRDYINEKFGVNFTPDVKIVGDLRGNTDGVSQDCILEIKTTSIIHDDVRKYKAYTAQLLFYMDLYGYENGMLAVYERPDDYSTRFKRKRLHLYNISIYDYSDLLAEIRKQVQMFREDLAKLKGNPFLTEEELQPMEITEMVDKILVFEDQIKAMKRTEELIKNLKAELKAAMQASGIKKYTTNSGVQITLIPDGEPTVELKFNEKKLKNDDPDLYEKYLEPTPKKGRAGYVRITIPEGD